MRRIIAGQSKIYNKRRQIYIPKLVMEILGANVKDKLEWIIKKNGEVTVDLVKKKKTKRKTK